MVDNVYIPSVDEQDYHDDLAKSAIVDVIYAICLEGGLQQAPHRFAFWVQDCVREWQQDGIMEVTTKRGEWIRENYGEMRIIDIDSGDDEVNGVCITLLNGVQLLVAFSNYPELKGLEWGNSCDVEITLNGFGIHIPSLDCEITIWGILGIPEPEAPF